MFVKLLNRARQLVTTSVQMFQDRLRWWTKLPSTSPTPGNMHDLIRSKPQLVIENALLRQQLSVLNRSVKRPRLTRADRALLVLLVSVSWLPSSSGAKLSWMMKVATTGWCFPPAGRL